jgi:hypothetical protein
LTVAGTQYSGETIDRRGAVSLAIAMFGNLQHRWRMRFSRHYCEVHRRLTEIGRR